MPVPFPSLHRARPNRQHPGAARKLGLNALVLALSWLALGCPATAPSYLGLGAPLSREQWSTLKRLSVNVSAWNASDPVDWTAMGRSAARVESAESNLRALASSVGPGFTGAESARALTASALNVDPSRISFTGQPGFDPRPFLSPQNRRCYERPLTWAASESPLKPVPRVRVHCKAEHVRGFLELLDSGNRLELLPLREVEFDRACGVFAVCKDAAKDRLVLDARPANAYEDPTNPWVRSLASVEQLRYVFLQDSEDVFVYSEDIRDFDHGFEVGAERAKRNILRLRLRPKACEGLLAYRKDLASEDWLVPALKTVAMGDTAAVGLAQCAHLGVVLSTGEVSLESFVTLEGRPPRSGPICGLMIDDFVVLDRVERRRPVPKGPGIIQAVRTAYAAVHLPRHEKKAVEGASIAEFWGCLFDGRSGKARPNYKRSVPLGFLVLQLVGTGRATADLLDSLVGGLVSCFQYQRRCLSLLQHVYSDPRPRDRQAAFTLSKGIRGELVAAVALLPQCDIDLRARAVPFVLATDASNEAAAICPVPKDAAQEMYRHSISKGLWNKLLSPVASYLRCKELGDPAEELPGSGDCYSSHPLWEELATSQPFFDFGRIVHVRVPRHINIGEMRAALRAEERLARRFQDVKFVLLQDSQVSLAAMSKGRSSSASLNRELRRSLGTYLGAGLRPGYAYVQSKHNPPDDRTRRTALRSPSREASTWFREFLAGDLGALDRFLSSCGLGIYLRPGSGTFSSAVRPALRTKDFPLGVPDATLVQRGRLERGNLKLSWVQQLCRLAESAGIFVILEHPQDSFFWRQEGWEPFSAASGWSDSFVDLCRFGAAFRKPTRLRVRGLFENIRLRCQCCEPHLVLRGRNRLSGTSWSMQGNERPKAFWDFLVQSVSDRLRKNRKIRLDVAGCAKTGSLRVGEAEHPGPRTRRVRAPQVLAAVSLVEPATAALRNKYWDAFGTWIESAAGPGAMLKFASASSEALGGLCSAPLRCRPWVREAWEYVTRWESLEPLQHRPPLPEPVLHGMCSLAVVWGWRRWAALTLTAFYGICRPGEPLRALRKHLVTSEDLLETGSEIFLRIPEPKTRKRGASVQHTQVKGPGYIVEFIRATFQGLPPDGPLYAGSPNMYRRRWDALLRALWIEPAHRLTPGSLRGGGAVRAYRSGEPLNEVQWRMRLRHQVTLGYYLQEVAALSILPALSGPARERVRSSAAFLPFALAREIAFTGGRVDAPEERAVAPGRLPGAEHGLAAGMEVDEEGRLKGWENLAQHIRDVFGRMGITDREAVALICGGHVYGRCHPESTGSGYAGAWVEMPTLFSNEYAADMVGDKWIAVTHDTVMPDGGQVPEEVRPAPGKRQYIDLTKYEGEEEDGEGQEAPDAKEYPPGRYKCLTQWVNIHEQPDVSSPVHGRCLQKEELSFLAVKVFGTELRGLAERGGWISLASGAGKPLFEKISELDPKPLQGRYRVRVAGAPVFEAPSASAREVGHLKASEEVSLDEVRIECDGTDVSVMGRLAGTAGGFSGWVTIYASGPVGLVCEQIVEGYNDKPRKPLKGQTGHQMMLVSDMVLLWDPGFREHLEAYAEDEDLLKREFGEAFKKLTELGCPWSKDAPGPATGLITGLANAREPCNVVAGVP
eukprot:s1227_g4.t1